MIILTRRSKGITKNVMSMNSNTRRVLLEEISSGIKNSIAHVTSPTTAPINPDDMAVRLFGEWPQSFDEISAVNATANMPVIVKKVIFFMWRGIGII